MFNPDRKRVLSNLLQYSFLNSMFNNDVQSFLKNPLLRDWHRFELGFTALISFQVVISNQSFSLQFFLSQFSFSHQNHFNKFNAKNTIWFWKTFLLKSGSDAFCNARFHFLKYFDFWIILFSTHTFLHFFTLYPNAMISIRFFLLKFHVLPQKSPSILIHSPLFLTLSSFFKIASSRSDDTDLNIKQKKNMPR